MEESEEKKLLDRDGAMDRIGDDVELYKEIRLLFLRDAPAQLTALRAAALAFDRGLIERHSHSLKSAAANLGADRLKLACGTIEESCKTVPHEKILTQLKKIEDEFALALVALRTGATGISSE